MSSSTSSAQLTIRCRRCGGVLTDAGNDMWSCPGGHDVPVIGGVLDCRPPLSRFDVDSDRDLAMELARLEGATLEELLRHYWKNQPDVSPHLVERFVTGDLIAGQRASAVADQIEALLGAPIRPDAHALEVGGGTGALGAELATRCASVVITDISLAWLVLASKRVRDMGLGNVTVVAATGDDLPVEPGSVDFIVAADVIEHVPSATEVIKHCYSVLRPEGALWLSTPNRLSLTPEPHVRLWGVGLLPRRLGRAYVRRVRRLHYDDIETLSLFTLRRLAAATGGSWDVTAPEITAPVRATYRPLARLFIDAYHVIRRVPVLRSIVLVAAPLFHVVIRRPAHG